MDAVGLCLRPKNSFRFYKKLAMVPAWRIVITHLYESLDWVGPRCQTAPRCGSITRGRRRPESSTTPRGAGSLYPT